MKELQKKEPWEEIKDGEGLFDYHFKCQFCNSHLPSGFVVAPDFCPHCGEDMFGKKKSNQKLDERIDNLLKKVGVPQHYKGYSYLKDALMLSVLDKTYTNALHERLYAELSKKYGNNVLNIERSIRHAIDVSFLLGNPEEKYRLFGETIDPDKGKVANKQFIVTLVEHLRKGA